MNAYVVYHLITPLRRVAGGTFLILNFQELIIHPVQEKLYYFLTTFVVRIVYLFQQALEVIPPVWLVGYIIRVIFTKHLLGGLPEGLFLTEKFQLMKPGVLLLLFLLVFPGAGAQDKKVSAGFWNVENLYDTIPSLFYDDSGYTPSGRYGWNTERYFNKIKNLARVIDDMDLDVLGLAEVENEEVVKDLVTALSTDYNYIHRHTNDSRGMDAALLYKGDKFVPEKVRQVNSGTSRQFLYVKGELKGHRVDLVVCHLPSRMNKKGYRERAFASLSRFADSLSYHDRASRVIIMGDFNAAPSDRIFRKYFTKPEAAETNGFPFFSPFLKQASLGAGTYRYKGKWEFIDNILVSIRFWDGPLCYTASGVFINEYMLRREHGRAMAPYRTFSSGRHTGGYSDHLPIYAVFETPEASAR